MVRSTNLKRLKRYLCREVQASRYPKLPLEDVFILAQPSNNDNYKSPLEIGSSRCVNTLTNDSPTSQANVSGLIFHAPPNSGVLRIDVSCQTEAPSTNATSSPIRAPQQGVKCSKKLNFELTPIKPKSSSESNCTPEWKTPELIVNRTSRFRLHTYQKVLNSPSTGNPIKKPTSVKPEGRRLISILSMEACLNLAAKHGGKCSSPKLYVHKERREGLRSNLLIDCYHCKDTFLFDTDAGSQTLPVNEAAAWAGNATGVGYTALAHSLATLDLPFMNYKTYQRMEKIYVVDLKKASKLTLKQNCEEEKTLAKQLGRFDDDGIPWTDVIGDGQWSKRSYGQKGTALSGSAVIIGTLTKKPLFVGVRNKYCVVCDKNPSNIHDCYKNWDGTSSAMETDIILEGFRKSLPVHGLRFKRYIGDGDSSVIVAIHNVYHTEKFFTDVEKIECINHLFRRMKTNLLLLSSNTAYDCYPRKLLAPKIDAITKACRYASLLHIENQPTSTTDTLSQDLGAIQYHIFGDHTRCSLVICENGKLKIPSKYSSRVRGKRDKEQNPEEPMSEKNNSAFKTLKNSKIWDVMTGTFNRLKSNSKSLLYNTTSNIAESFQSQMNKFSSGKRLNHVGRGGYKKISMQATLGFQYGPSHYATMFKLARGYPPSNVWMERVRKEEKLKASRVIRSANGIRRKYNRKHRTTLSKLPDFFSRSRPVAGDPDYGNSVRNLDILPEEMSRKIKNYIDSKSVANKDEQWKFQLETSQQFLSETFVRRRCWKECLQRVLLGEYVK